MRRRFAAFLLSLPLAADVKLPAIIGDHMVLQSGAPVRIFGWASPGEPVTVQFSGQTSAAVASQGGVWSAWLKPMEPGTAGEMKITGHNSIAIQDVLVGEVWIGSGQSNMQWSVRASNNAAQETEDANYPRIRLFSVPRKSSPEPLEDVEAKWEVCTPDTVKEFSAVLYFFGRDLHKHLNAPFGLINTSYGGTPAQAWTTRESLHSDPALLPILGEWNRLLALYPEASMKFQAAMAEWDQAARQARASGAEPPRRPLLPAGPGHAHTPAGLYNAMIHPLIQYTIKGAIWYQGESNASKVQAPLYKRLFETMIQDWRRVWGIGDFPFLFVQLANFAKAGSPGDWVLVQEAQEQTLELRRTGMAVINDIGDPVDIHPRNKQDAAARLALAARHVAYQEQGLVYAGPRFRTVSAETALNGGGASLRVWFDSAGAGLKSRGGELRGFEVAGADRQFQPAQASIDGKTVVVSSPHVALPVAVRYAWASNPDCNLINSEGLPAGVFRSHPW